MLDKVKQGQAPLSLPFSMLGSRSSLSLSSQHIPQALQQLWCLFGHFQGPSHPGGTLSLTQILIKSQEEFEHRNPKLHTMCYALFFTYVKVPTFLKHIKLHHHLKYSRNKVLWLEVTPVINWKLNVSCNMNDHKADTCYITTTEIKQYLWFSTIIQNF